MPCANGQSEGKCARGADAFERVRTALGPAAHDAAPADTDKEKTAANAPKRSLSGCLEWPEKRTSRLAVLKSGWQRRMTVGGMVYSLMHLAQPFEPVSLELIEKLP